MASNHSPRGLLLCTLFSLAVLSQCAQQAQNPYIVSVSTVAGGGPLTDVQSDTPLPPGNPLAIAITVNNPSSQLERISQVHISWPGRPTDFVADPTMITGVQCKPVIGAALPNQVTWTFDPNHDNLTVVPAGEAISAFFQIHGTVGNPDASFLPIQITITDDVYAPTTKIVLVQMAPPTPLPTPSATTATKPVASQGATPSPSPSAIPKMAAESATRARVVPTLPPIHTPSPIPTKPAIDTPSPTPTKAATQTPSPTPTKVATQTPSPTPTKVATQTPSPTPTKVATQSPSPTPTKVATHTPTPAATAKSNQAQTPTPTPTATSSNQKVNNRRLLALAH